MNLAELVLAHPDHFSQRQSWYLGELFMYVAPVEHELLTPAAIVHVGQVPTNDAELRLAVDWAHTYLRDPSNEIWDCCLWCKDVDRYGQRVYLMRQHGLMEIHRYLHITDRFGVPVQ